MMTSHSNGDQTMLPSLPQPTNHPPTRRATSNLHAPPQVNSKREAKRLAFYIYMNVMGFEDMQHGAHAHGHDRRCGQPYTAANANNLQWW